jgi:hypothetical protein
MALPAILAIFCWLLEAPNQRLLGGNRLYSSIIMIE